MKLVKLILLVVLVLVAGYIVKTKLVNDDGLPKGGRTYFPETKLPIISAKLGEEFSLYGGQTARITDQNIEVKYESIIRGGGGRGIIPYSEVPNFVFLVDGKTLYQHETIYTAKIKYPIDDLNKVTLSIVFTEDTCKNYDSESQYLCYQKLATGLNDTKYCNKIVSNDRKNGCYEKFAEDIASKKYSTNLSASYEDSKIKELCSNTKNATGYCLFVKLATQNDIRQCTDIQYQEVWRGACYKVIYTRNGHGITECGLLGEKEQDCRTYSTLPGL